MRLQRWLRGRRASLLERFVRYLYEGGYRVTWRGSDLTMHAAQRAARAYVWTDE